MYLVTLEVKINNAKDRGNDRYYRLDTGLSLPPLPGTKIRVVGRSIVVDGYAQEIGDGQTRPVVFLEKQNQAFKGASFENLCKAFEKAGFKLHKE